VLEEQRAKARKRMLRALNSRRYTRFVEAFIALLEWGPSRRSKAARRPILDVSPDQVRRRYRRVRKIGDRITEESPAEDYHKLRKRGRRLRYALEFLRDVYGGATEELVRLLKKS
jgi:triphosphatase